MRLFLRLYLAVLRLSWTFLAVFLPALFLLAWASMRFFEGDVPIGQGRNFWWYFIVTTSTVGYGDLFPVTTGGRITGACIMVGGIGMFAAVVTKLAEGVSNTAKKRRKGMIQLSKENHVVIFGYRKGGTEKMVAEINGNGRGNIILCDNIHAENPLPGIVEFVHGDLSSNDVLKRACVDRASKILIYGETDEQTIAVSLAANSVAAVSAHIAAYVRSDDAAVHLHRINKNIVSVVATAIPLMVQSVYDPGAASVINSLVSSTDSDSTNYRLDLPAGVNTKYFGDLMLWLKQHHNALAIAVATDHSANADFDLNPPIDLVVKGGMSIFYISDHRLNITDWSNWGF